MFSSHEPISTYDLKYEKLSDFKWFAANLDFEQFRPNMIVDDRTLINSNHFGSKAVVTLNLFVNYSIGLIYRFGVYFTNMENIKQNILWHTDTLNYVLVDQNCSQKPGTFIHRIYL